MPAGKTPHDQNVAGHSNRLQKLFCHYYFLLIIEVQTVILI
ncbi:Uncharacterised protein [Segatella copri]|nr:Uncharacterised protein [Segatella copri]